MSTSDHVPLSAACVRALSDKVYDKRKAAAMEIEKLVRDAVAANNPQQIKRVIDLLEGYSLGLNPHVKKGGLIGLAAAAAGLGTQHSAQYVVDIIRPIVSCLSDNNSHVRYYGTESLYNVVRVARHNILPVFNDVFTALTMLVTDPDSNVRVGADMLDSTLKGIVKECGEDMDLCALIPVLRPKLYTSNSMLQTLLVSWLVVLHGIPSLELVPVLTEILDALMMILTSPHPEVVKATDGLLMSLLECCRDHADSVNCIALTPQLVVHAQSHNVTLKNMALCWLNELITLGRRQLLPHAAQILAAALPSMAHSSSSKSRGVAEEVNQKIMDLLEPSDDVINENGTPGGEESVNLPSIVCVLLKHLKGDSKQCKFIALHWLSHLLKKFPNKMHGELECVCCNMLPVLSDQSDDVVVLVVSLLANIADASQNDTVTATASSDAGDGSSQSSPHFRRVLRLLLDALAANKELLDNRGPLIVRELCALLNPIKVYLCLSSLLQEEVSQQLVTPSLSPEFVANMSKNMSTILITSRELFSLRLQLRKLETKDSAEVFVSLFRCWSASPISVILLCLLSQSYEQSVVLVHLLAEAEVTVDFLVQVDKLVQLLESPIFTYLRLDLLKNDSSSNALVETLYGLLMILPQSSSYTTLATRLRNLPPAHRIPHREDATDATPPLAAQQSARLTSQSKSDASAAKNSIDFDALIVHFRKVQTYKLEQSRKEQREALEKNSRNIETLMANARLAERGQGTNAEPIEPGTIVY
uniref:Protein VAC14 homolog n=1 Tax=Hirondellea gigas TaxID=1518452 RepID=A0A2P2I7F6_9CRUS